MHLRVADSKIGSLSGRKPGNWGYRECHFGTLPFRKRVTESKRNPRCVIDPVMHLHALYSGQSDEPYSRQSTPEANGSLKRATEQRIFAKATTPNNPKLAQTPISDLDHHEKREGLHWLRTPQEKKKIYPFKGPANCAVSLVHQQSSCEKLLPFFSSGPRIKDQEMLLVHFAIGDLVSLGSLEFQVPIAGTRACRLCPP